MKKTILATCILAAALAAGYAAEKSKVNLNDKEDRINYLIGMRWASDLQAMRIDVRRQALFGAIDDVLAGREPALSDEEFEKAFAELREHLQEVRAAQQAEFEKKGEDAKAKGEAFLEANKKREGVQTAASGLQYEVLRKGNGPRPSARSKVQVHYKGTFIDGSVFDSSYSAGQPSEFTVRQVIKGWQEGLQLMQEGAKYKFYIPWQMAYGEKGKRSGLPGSPDIPPYSALVFEVELLKVLSSPR